MSAAHTTAPAEGTAQENKQENKAQVAMMSTQELEFRSKLKELADEGIEFHPLPMLPDEHN